MSSFRLIIIFNAAVIFLVVIPTIISATSGPGPERAGGTLGKGEVKFFSDFRDPLVPTRCYNGSTGINEECRWPGGVFVYEIDYEHFDARVLNGSNVPPHKYPMVVVIHGPRDVRCGGTILDANWVLTVATCGYGERTNSVLVTAGDHDATTVEGNEQVVRAVEIIRHDQFRYVKKSGNTWIPQLAFPNNIALIRVHPRFIFNEVVAPVNLPSSHDFTVIEDKETSAIITGFGQSRNLPAQVAAVLQEGNITLRHLEVCRKHEPNLIISDSHLCAGGLGRSEYISNCKHDEGNPLLLRHTSDSTLTQVGLFSFYDAGLFNLCIGGGLLIYVNLSHYLHWIKHQVGHHCERRKGYEEIPID